LERQLDPTSAAFVPRGDRPVTNSTHRNWTAVGNLDSRSAAIVDPRGLVTPSAGGWSLDWWIGADDRWHVPSREANVRQRLVDVSPVVETAMRIPGGDAVQRVFAVQRSSTEGGGELVVVEIENQSKVPVALALAVRPYNPQELSSVERIDLDDTAVMVDGQVAVLLPKTPPASAASTLEEGDSAATVMSGGAPARWPGPVECGAGLAQAAFVYPLAHSATLRVVLPLVHHAGQANGRRQGGRRDQLPATSSPASLPTALPGASDVARGWKSQSAREMRLEVPDARLTEAMEANLRYLLLLHEGAEITSGPTSDPFELPDREALVAALDYYGFHDEAARVLASLAARQGPDGRFLGDPNEWAATGAVLCALAEHWRLTRDRGLVEAMVDPIVDGAQWIQHMHHQSGPGRRRRPRGGDESLQGLLPAGVSVESPGSVDYFYSDDLWSVAGLRSAAELLGVVEQTTAAADVARHADAFWNDLDQAMRQRAEVLATQAMPAGPRCRIDAAVVGPLVAVPLRLVAAADERIVATLDTIRNSFTLDEGPALFLGHTGLSPSLTMRLAQVELAAGDRRCLDRLGWLLDAASGTWTWPEVIHPRFAGGCRGDGHHGRVAADLLKFVRELLVREVDGGVALSSVVPDEWLGQGWEVHDAPTAHGLLSYAVRWHGDRPALLWDLRPDGAEADAGPDDGTERGSEGDDQRVELTAPGLDPAWSTTERRGEALLARVEPSGAIVPSADAPSADVVASQEDVSFH
jgi:hypothetical protein